MNPFLEVALKAAEAAREVILGYYEGGFEVEIKADQTPVTIADKEAETLIRKHLATAFPEHGIYGEEWGSDGADREYLWLIDPIDGTKSFVKGYGMFSTQIALMHQGHIVLGVSCAPAMGELAWAARGEGAWLNGERLSVSSVEQAAEASVSTGNLRSMAKSGRWASLGELLAVANRTRGYGDYYHYHRLAAGQLDAVIESDVNILDIAALSVIIEEAGGVFTDLDGAPPKLETRSVLTAPAVLHAKLLALFQQA
jgi:histidinol-phosphatase